MLHKLNLATAAIVSALVISSSAWADYTGTTPNYISISFVSSFALAHKSTYDISFEPSAKKIGFWVATDTRFRIALIGIDAPIARVAPPGHVNGGDLNACGYTCFGGTIQTDNSGNIVRWNLVADDAVGRPFLTFITYNTPHLGSIDALATALKPRQLCNVCCDPSSFVPGQQFRCASPTGIFFEVDVGECLPVVVPDDEATPILFLDVPGRWEALHRSTASQVGSNLFSKPILYYWGREPLCCGLRSRSNF